MSLLMCNPSAYFFFFCLRPWCLWARMNAPAAATATIKTTTTSAASPAQGGNPPPPGVGLGLGVMLGTAVGVAPGPDGASEFVDLGMENLKPMMP